MNYDFDQVVNRKGTNCVKYDFNAQNGKPDDVIPLWVADMDFLSPPAVREAIAKTAAQGIYGYTGLSDAYYDAVIGWYTRRFGWTPKREWHTTTPGVVHALACAVRAFARHGEGVMIQPPVYPPFAATVEMNHRKLVENPLIYENGTYRMDFEQMEQKIQQEQVKVFLLCSPHNPVGRVWTKEELLRLGEICAKHHVVVVSDEIHSDFVYKGHTHHVFASINSQMEQNCVICTSTSKTFNVAGLQHSNIFIPNPELREAFLKVLRSYHTDGSNLFGPAACQAAYEQGADWLDAMLRYLEGNITYVKDFLSQNIPEITMPNPDGTYLLWFDCRNLGIPADQLDSFFTKAGLWLNNGAAFGKQGEGFMRVNVACPRCVLQKAMQRLLAAVQTLRKQ
ncbi:MAG: MalY/PatB family protein [Massiliimalia sp.]|jgi:cystathionine beta-lyase